MAGYDMAVDVVSSSSAPSCSLNGPSYRNRAPCALKSGNNKGGLHTRSENILSQLRSFEIRLMSPSCVYVQVSVWRFWSDPTHLNQVNKGVEVGAWMVLVCDWILMCVVEVWFPRTELAVARHDFSSGGKCTSWGGHVHPRGQVCWGQSCLRWKCLSY